MRQPVIDRKDSNLEFNQYDVSCLRYKEKLFTGTIIYNDTNPVSYTEYKNGEIDGRDVSYYSNGRIQEDCIYREGEYISGKHWYENGQLRYDSENNHIIFDEDGTLTKKNGNWFYKNGNERLKRSDEGTKLFSSTGDLAILIEPSDIIINTYPTYKTTFYNKILIETYKDLLEHIYLFPEDNFNFRQSVFVSLNSWIIELYRTNNKKEALHIINTMINDSETKLKENLHFRIKQIEENFVYNSKSFIKHLESGEFNYNNHSNINNNLSKIVFD